jgi:hypothetical protein
VPDEFATAQFLQGHLGALADPDKRRARLRHVHHDAKRADFAPRETAGGPPPGDTSDPMSTLRAVTMPANGAQSS